MLDEQIGQYRITGRLGKGGMGEIFSAHDQKLDRTVAVKFIAGALTNDESARRLFFREARAAAALNHPFVCTVHDVLEHRGQPLIVMERVDGETLQSRLEKAPIPVDFAARIAAEVAEALEAAHARGIVHRDVKSGNIMITPAGHVKVMDFGLALLTAPLTEDATAHKSEEEHARAMAGTLPYMAPEVLRGSPATPASDLYALGVVMYEMLTGVRPFRGNTSAVQVSEILEHSPTRPRDLNDAVTGSMDDLVMNLLAKDPSRRPAAAEIIAELRETPSSTRPKAPSLAVLPFRALTHDPDDADLGLLLADATTSELALLHSLIVRPTAAVLQYDAATLDAARAARELRVDYIVTGTVQRSGARLRVGVQLINAAEERPLWSAKIDTAMDDIFAVQDDVSRKIVAALQVQFTSADEARIAKRQQPAGDVLDLYMKGRLAVLGERVPNINDAIDFFERALRLDPAHTPTLVALADAYLRLAFTWDPDSGWYERAVAISNRVEEIDPDLPEGHYIRGRLLWTPQAGFQHERAIREIAAAVAERPNLNEGFDSLGTILLHVGMVEEARQCYARALAINPRDMITRTHGWTEWLTGDYETALSAARAMSEEAQTSWAAYLVAFAALRLRDVDAAEEAIESGMRKFPANVLFHGARAVLEALRNGEAAALQSIERTLRNRRAFGHFHHAELDIACAMALLGRDHDATEHLRSVIRGGFPCLPAIENDPLLASVRDKPQYAELLHELRKESDHFASVVAELFRDDEMTQAWSES